MAYNLSVQKRTEQGHKAKKLRKAGLVTSVVYGAGEPILTCSTYNDTDKVLKEAGYHSPIKLAIDGGKQLVIVKNVSVDPVSRRITNVEFQAVSEDEIVEATAPIKIVDFEQSEASKKHYTILQTLEEVEVKAKPSKLPKEILVDASRLTELEDKLTLADLQLPGGVELADKELASETVVANVYDPAAEAEKRENEESKVEPEKPEAEEEKKEEE